MRRATIIVVALVALGGASEARKQPKRRAKPAAAAAPRTPASDPADVAALAKAWAAYRGGDYAAAFAVAEPLVQGGAKLLAGDYALYVAAQSAWMLGDREKALPLFRKLAGASGSRFRALAAWRVADCLWDLGRGEDARKAYEKLVGADGGDEGVARFRIAEAHAAAGREGAAAEAWRRVALEHPAHPLAARAIARLEAAGAPPLTPRERITRAANLTRGRAWPQALAELALVGDAESEAIVTLRDYWIGTTLFKMRRQYPRAGELLIRVHDKMGGRAAEALFHGARALSRGDRDDEAIRWYAEVVRKYPHSEWAAEAQFLSGWLEYNRGNFRAALPGLQGLLDDYPRSKFADDALWYLGYSHYLLGEYAEALPLLDRLAGHTGELEGGKGRFWKARALHALGRVDEGNAELRELVGKFPLSWYAILARARLKTQGIEIGPFGDDPDARGGAPAFGAVDERLAGDPLIARGDELLAAGMPVEAGFELRRGEKAFLQRYGVARALPLLMDRYRKAGNFNRPWMLAEVYGGKVYRSPPTSAAARAWWEHSYPQAYREWVEKYQDVGSNPPYYLYAIMRKESGFDPHVVSYADALGLMQMIPPTTRRVAPRLGLQYTDDLLYDPEQNVRVAAWYIGALYQKFKQQVPLAAGSYNSGPRPVMKWLDKYGDRPMDELVELVAFSQSREYMKKVTGIYARYLYLYEGIDYEQPLAVDREYVKNDIDY